MGRKPSILHCSPRNVREIPSPQADDHSERPTNIPIQDRKVGVNVYPNFAEFPPGIDEPFLAGNRSIYLFGYVHDE